MRILLALRSLEQAEGGPITAAHGLSAALVRRGHRVTITSHDDGGGRAAAVPALDGVEILRFPLTRRLWEHSASYAAWLRSNVAAFDVVIINSMWISHVHHAAASARRNDVPYIVRPHGCLTRSDLSHHALRKKIYWTLHDRRVARRAVFVHCTSTQELDDARGLGLSNVENIPLGVDESLFDLELSGRSRRDVVFMGRIAEKKGVDILIRAMAADRAAMAGFRLHVLGVDHRGLRPGLEDLARELDVADRVEFHGHVEGDRRARFLATAGMMVLPSKDENFGLAVAEGMAAGLPVVITPHVSHQGLVAEERAGLVVDRTPEAFAAAMATVAGMPDDDFAAMQQRARQAVARSYSWSRTASLIEAALSDRLDAGRG